MIGLIGTVKVSESEGETCQARNEESPREHAGAFYSFLAAKLLEPKKLPSRGLNRQHIRIPRRSMYFFNAVSKPFKNIHDPL